MENPKMELSKPSPAGSLSKETTLTQEITRQTQEMAGIAVAASAKAEVETAYALAVKRPRSEDDSRFKILRLCKNLKFAEGAKYKKPQGNKPDGRGGWIQSYVEGASIRFAEEAMRIWGNIKTMQSVIYDDATKRIIKITVIDLESNISYSKEFLIEKTVERKSGKNRDVIFERTNSSGEKVSVVVATEDEIANKEAALASKTIRTNGLRLIPDYILSEALEEIEATVKEGVDKDPDAAKRTIVDNFSKLNVSPKSLEEYLGHALEISTPAEIVELKQVFTMIREGHSTWAEVMEGKKGESKPPEIAVIGFIAPPQLEGETAWEYEERCAKAKKEFETKGFKAGDAKTHSHVAQPLK